MSAPTLWEEGRASGSRVVRLAVLASAVLVAVDLLLTRRLSPVFDIGFVLVCIGSALAVRPRDFFRIGVMPPFLLLGLVTVLAVVHPVAIAGASDGIVQAAISGLAHHSGALFAADVNALVVLAVRHRIIGLRHDKQVRRTSPYAVAAVPALPPESYSNREGSPLPTLVTSATPEEKSTTVVGSEDVSPQSRTASSR